MLGQALTQVIKEATKKNFDALSTRSLEANSNLLNHIDVYNNLLKQTEKIFLEYEHIAVQDLDRRLELEKASGALNDENEKEDNDYPKETEKTFAKLEVEEIKAHLKEAEELYEKGLNKMSRAFWQ